MKGQVCRYNKEKRYGFIQSFEDGHDYFFHIDSVINFKHEQIQNGMEVEFEAGEGPKGKRAESVAF